MHYQSSDSNWEEYYSQVADFLFSSHLLLEKENVKEGRIERKYEAFYKREFKYSDCGAVGANQIAIKPNGDITICHGFWNTDESLGNICEMEFSEIFQTELYKRWNQNITLHRKECLECPYIYMCGGGCAMESKNMFGSEMNLDIPFCIYTKRITELILKEFYDLSKK